MAVQGHWRSLISLSIKSACNNFLLCCFVRIMCALNKSLAINSNLRSILSRFRHIEGLLLKKTPHEVCVILLRLDADLGAPKSEYPSLIISTIFKVTQPIRLRYSNVTDGHIAIPCFVLYALRVNRTKMCENLYTWFEIVVWALINGSNYATVDHSLQTATEVAVADECGQFFTCRLSSLPFCRSQRAARVTAGAMRAGGKTTDGSCCRSCWSTAAAGSSSS